MQIRSFFKFPCPNCKFSNQRFPLWESVEKKTAGRCEKCGTETVSELSSAKYAAYYMIAQLLASPAWVVLIVGLYAARWIWVMVGSIAVFIIVFLPVMFMHSRNAQALIKVERPVKYGKKRVT